MDECSSDNPVEIQSSSLQAAKTHRTSTAGGIVQAQVSTQSSNALSFGPRPFFALLLESRQLSVTSDAARSLCSPFSRIVKTLAVEHILLALCRTLCTIFQDASTSPCLVAACQTTSLSVVLLHIFPMRPVVLVLHLQNTTRITLVCAEFAVTYLRQPILFAAPLTFGPLLLAFPALYLPGCRCLRHYLDKPTPFILAELGHIMGI